MPSVPATRCDDAPSCWRDRSRFARETDVSAIHEAQLPTRGRRTPRSPRLDELDAGITDDEEVVPEDEDVDDAEDDIA